MIGVTMLWRKGQFFQTLDESGWQHESAVEWSPDDLLAPADARAEVEIEGRKVALRAWQYTITGIAEAWCRSCCSTATCPTTIRSIAR